jgi:hypothetical protein
VIIEWDKMALIKRLFRFMRSLLLILIISFILGELTFQLLKPNIPYQYSPQKIIQNFWEESPIVEATLKKSHEGHFLMSGARFDSIVRTNSLGWRDDEPDSRKKVLVIGDSFTFGWGVNNNETIPYNLEESPITNTFFRLSGSSSLQPNEFVLTIESNLAPDIKK